MLSSGTPNYGVLLGNADNKDKYALFSKVGILVNPFQTRRSCTPFKYSVLVQKQGRQIFVRPVFFSSKEYRCPPF